jgi:molybdenum cofactor biosynthesis enzyme MoaA
MDRSVIKEQISMRPVNSAAPRIAGTDKHEPDQADTFCVLPFQHICVGTEGTARLCCVTAATVSDDGIPMSLYTKSFPEIWNSPYMREVRRKMLNGEQLWECEVCYKQEAATSTSHRTWANSQSLSDRPVEPALLHTADYYVKEMPSYIKLELGNLCNLKCRMCVPQSSSEIERDPVHSAWVGGTDPLHAIWDNNAAVIGPGPRIGVARRGVYSEEKSGDERVYWTDRLAEFDLPISPTTRLDRLVIQLSSNFALDRFCMVLVNGEIGFQGCLLPSSSNDISIDLKRLPPSDRFKIEVTSTTIFNPQLQRDEGLPLLSMILHRTVSPAISNVKEPLRSRLGKPGLWYNDNDLLFGELLADAENLRQLCLAGAEPQLEPRYAHAIEYLIKRDVSQNIHLELITNATIINKRFLENLKKFKSVSVHVSLDGVGPVQEYIRYPARWPVVHKNVRILREEYGFYVLAIPTVQAYNMLFLADIYKFAREMGIQVSCSNILQYPEWLRPDVMPRSAHRLAAARLREFAAVVTLDEKKDGLDWQHEQILSLIDHFESFDVPLDEAALRTFNVFTNDLDVSRGQSFRDSLPELFGLIIESGYKWTDGTVHAHGRQPRRTARERLHAWV